MLDTQSSPNIRTGCSTPKEESPLGVTPLVCCTPHQGKTDWDVKLAGVAGTSNEHRKTSKDSPGVRGRAERVDAGSRVGSAADDREQHDDDQHRDRAPPPMRSVPSTADVTRGHPALYAWIASPVLGQ